MPHDSSDWPAASVHRVADVSHFGSPNAPAHRHLLLEVPHGATRATDFDALQDELRGAYPDDLRAFYFVNTDVGAPELAAALARRWVAGAPDRAATVIRCLIPRTFVDCNRVIAPDAAPRASQAGEVTPGLHAWVRDPHDAELLLARHRRYTDLVECAAGPICAAGGRLLMVHSYAPRSLDVPVDDDIVATLRREYEPENLQRWPLRAPVDLIVDDPDGRSLADAALVASLQSELPAAGLEVARNAAYALHPVTTAHRLAARWPGRTLCFEVRRDLLVAEFVPFVELQADPSRIAAVAEPLATALESAT